MELSLNEFDLFRKYIYDVCGIALGDDKQYLVLHRIGPLVESSGLKSFIELYYLLKENKFPNLREEVINSITTNETSFFRDIHPFNTFRDQILPAISALIRERKKYSVIKGYKTRLWSAGAASGQEPYSIAMLIHEHVSANMYSGISLEDFYILATDISARVLAKAKKGEYTDSEIRQGLPAALMMKYFKKKGDRWVIEPHIRNIVEFRFLNMMQPFTNLGNFDVIFCRNVLCYFNDSTKREIFEQFYRMLSDQGVIFFGSSESVYSLTDKFESVWKGETIFYRKKR